MVKSTISHQKRTGMQKKNKSSYMRTKASTLKRLKELSDKKGPKAVYHQVYDENGGMLTANSASDLPRNRKQVVNHKPPLLSKKIDSLAILLQECKRQQMCRNEDAFIREVTGAPELRCVLAFDWQLEEIVQFCTEPSSFTVFSADPTFNLGPFNLTVTTYRNLKVVTKRDGKHPLMIGPLLLSQTKTTESYMYFFGKLGALNRDIRNILAFGTDGEEALIEGMKSTMPHAVQLRCFGHFRDNCKMKLRKCNVPDTVQQTFLDDLFGKRYGETFERGKTCH